MTTTKIARIVLPLVAALALAATAHAATEVPPGVGVWLCSPSGVLVVGLAIYVVGCVARVLEDYRKAPGWARLLSVAASGTLAAVVAGVAEASPADAARAAAGYMSTAVLVHEVVKHATRPIFDKLTGYPTAQRWGRILLGADEVKP